MYRNAKIQFIIKNPSTIPYIMPPDLLNCLIIGRFPIISANKFSTSRAILSIIINPINVIPSTSVTVRLSATYCAAFSFEFSTASAT